MYPTIPIHWNINSATSSPGRSRAGPALYLFSLLDLGHEQREVRTTSSLICIGYWRFSELHPYSTLHRYPPLPLLATTSENSWTALSIGRCYVTPLAASTSTSLQPALSVEVRDLATACTGSLVTIVICLVCPFWLYLVQQEDLKIRISINPSGTCYLKSGFYNIFVSCFPLS
jgi:hypothetical protein